MATEEQTDVSTLNNGIATGHESGQRLTITNRTVAKLSFYLVKTGSPGGTLTFKIRKVSDDSVVASKLWGNSNDISTTPAWYEVIFDSPVLVDEEVYVLAYASAGVSGNILSIYSSYPNDVKANEYAVDRLTDGSYTNWTDRDMGYIYTYEASASPSVTTQAVTVISGTTATGNGNITALGDAAVTQHGVCWNTGGTPTTEDDKTEEGAGSTGAFTSSITGLVANTLYYVRAYATNIAGTGYGSEVNFTTDTTPTVTTQTMQDVVGDTATGRGNITALGGDNPTAHGHCWAETADPTTSDSSVDNGAATATGTFISAITGLTAGTGYYVRAYATNAVGTGYGANVYFIASTDRAGYIWVEGSGFHLFDENAIERKLEGIGTTEDAFEFSEIKLTPKASSTGAEGTLFYDSDDNHIYVATE